MHIFEGEIQPSVFFKIPLWLKCTARVENCCPTARETWSYFRWSIHRDLLVLLIQRGYLGDTSGKESACQRRRHKRHGFNPWVGKIPWSKKWHPTPVFLPGKFRGQWSLTGYSPWGHKELDTTEWLSTSSKWDVLGSKSRWAGDKLGLPKDCARHVHSANSRLRVQ